jgi:hypothetical protein
MMEKPKKNLLGRDVSKSTGKTRNADGSYTRSKDKVVFNKKGTLVKYKTKETKYTPSGEPVGKLQAYKPAGTTVTKKKFSDKGQMTSSKTRAAIRPVRASIKKK